MAVPDDSDDLLASAARMYYLDQLDQRDIGDLLGVSRSTVSRLLKSARERGIVQISVSPYDPRDRQREAELRDRLGARHAIVIKTTGRPSAQVGRTVGYFAAPAVSALVSDLLASNLLVSNPLVSDPLWARVGTSSGNEIEAASRGGGVAIGVAGGRTLAALVTHIAPVESAQNVTVVQLMGNIGPKPVASDGLEISHELARRFRSTLYTVNAPAIVQDSQARDMLLAHQHIRLVWDLFDSLSLAFVGIGTLADSVFVEQGVFNRTELDRLRLSGVVGEICGRFFDRDGRECATELRDRVLSIDLDVLRERDEVIGITNGPGRAAAVRAALRGGLITSLVIDDIGAAAVLAAANEP